MHRVSGDSLLDSTLIDAARAVRSREISPVELTEQTLDRIATLEPDINAFAEVMAEAALARAGEAEAEICRGDYRGALHGLPLAVKDLFDTAGSVTGAGSRVPRGRVPARDAACVERIRAAGAVIVGKTHTHEFAYGVITPQTRNPWNLDCVPGGSSGGSAAAVTTGECFGALGTDTGGSIRIPSSACGAVGLKPTYGLVPTRGVTPLAWSLDHAGPIARTVGDCAALLEVIAGFDAEDPSSVRSHVPAFARELDLDLEGLAVGVPTNYFFDNVDPEVETLVRAGIAKLEGMGACLREITVPFSDHYRAVSYGIVMPEASAYHRQSLRSHAPDYDDGVRLMLEAGETVTAVDYIGAQRLRRVICSAWDDIFTRVDAVVAPTIPTGAVRVGQTSIGWPNDYEEPVVDAYVRLACPANIAGLPALSVPCGMNSSRLPVGMQIIGRPFEESTVLGIGHRYEEGAIKYSPLHWEADQGPMLSGGGRVGLDPPGGTLIERDV